MAWSRVCLGMALSVLMAAPAAAQGKPDCAVMDYILKQARTDFPSLRQKRMSPGSCYFKGSEYGCAWAFPGDAFDMSDAQADRLKQCIAAHPTAQPIKGKRGSTAFTIDPDLTVSVLAPEIDNNGNWTVRLLIQSSYKPQ